MLVVLLTAIFPLTDGSDRLCGRSKRDGHHDLVAEELEDHDNDDDSDLLASLFLGLLCLLFDSKVGYLFIQNVWFMASDELG